jgi:hypothetical protein
VSKSVPWNFSGIPEVESLGPRRVTNSSKSTWPSPRMDRGPVCQVGLQPEQGAWAQRARMKSCLPDLKQASPSQALSFRLWGDADVAKRDGEKAAVERAGETLPAHSEPSMAPCGPLLSNRNGYRTLRSPPYRQETRLGRGPPAQLSPALWRRRRGVLVLPRS